MTDSPAHGWARYARALIRGDSYASAARRAGFDKSAFSRWQQGKRPDPVCAVKLARAYGGDVLEALVAAGLITAEEAGQPQMRPARMLREAERLADGIRAAAGAQESATAALRSLLEIPEVRGALVATGEEAGA